ncbi:hypothetical protein PU629_02535 [Pullulanibacillus sp. KACC 23026]|uniref:hypothetical protein n=1 Tax=Pullulanibacillus sp. KACC 23026 TaxID=3028315 RepID=UPI0023B0CFAA|nr:hypothetical protein [Pullulanibacillus sp. KACC 23026]WEG13262.1 hypothetical protein PU629_02535 [Pullulanibacillus sp. KACC 23026]
MYSGYTAPFNGYSYSRPAYFYTTPIQWGTADPINLVNRDERQKGSYSPPLPRPPGSQHPNTPPGHGHGHEAGPPTAPPPSFVPKQNVETHAVNSTNIRRCLFRYTYVRLKGHEPFWFYPTSIGRHSVSGYRWTGRRWLYMGLDLRQVISFTCY